VRTVVACAGEDAPTSAAETTANAKKPSNFREADRTAGSG
jgi:hypothetical protein